MKRITAAALAGAILGGLPALAFPAETPDATLELSGGTVAAGIGVSWAKGTLTYQGRSIPVSVKGLNLLKVGAGSVTAAGEVYHLANLKDFSGNYTAVTAGAALAGGGGVSAMKNEHGVVVRLRSTTQGVDLDLGVDGVAVKVEP